MPRNLRSDRRSTIYPVTDGTLTAPLHAGDAIAVLVESGTVTGVRITSRNPHAVALGALGGQARSALPPSELSRIGTLGGRPRQYRLSPTGALERRTGERWSVLMPPLDRAAQAARRRLLRRPEDGSE